MSDGRLSVGELEPVLDEIASHLSRAIRSERDQDIMEIKKRLRAIEIELFGRVHEPEMTP